MTFTQFKEKYRLRLTPQQEKAVLRTDGYTLILAVPGSGKTTVIVSRLGYMMECLGTDHNSILTLTYSVASCRDMKERFISLFGNNNVPQFRTINGICALIIMEYEKVMDRTSFELCDGENTMNDMLTEIYREIYGLNPDIGSISDLKRMIGYARNMMMTDDEADEYSDDGKLGAILSKYRERKKHMRVMDYDDQLEYAYTILRKYPQIRESFRSRYKYINVDEAQDTSKLQHEIIHLLTGNNLFMVGDEDQSIYGFRAAYPSALMDFEKRYPGALILLMEQNFRSTGNIIEGASKLIANNTQRRTKHMVTENPVGESINTVTISSYREQLPLLQRICASAKGENESSAILFRNNESAIPLIDMLERSGIPYSLRENDCLYFSNPAVTDMLLMLSYCTEPYNKEIFLKIAPRLGCGLTGKIAEQICRAAEKSGESVYDTFKQYINKHTDKSDAAQTLFYEIEHYNQRSIAQAIRNLHKDTCFGRFLDHRYADKMKIGVLVSIAKNCTDYNDFLMRIEYLRSIITSGKAPDVPCISLSTMHSAKGLEYDNVYIIDVKDGTLPGTPSQKSELHKLKEYIEEERRLFYVAVTRAKRKLTVIRYRSEYDGSRTDDSCFIRELFDEKISIYDISKKAVGKIKMKLSPCHREASEFTKGVRIIHKSFGAGRICGVDGDKCTVIFDSGIKKDLSVSICIDAGLISIKKD